MPRLSLAVLLFALPWLDAGPHVESAEDAALAQSVRGVVVDESGAAVRGARYWVSGFERRVDDAWELVLSSGMPQVRFTGADGSFEIPGDSGWRYDVDFDVEGYSPSFLLQAELGSEHRVALRRGRSVSGHVFQLVADEATPVEWATVQVRRSNARGLWFERAVTTDAGGRFELANLLPVANDGAAWSLYYSGAELPLDPEEVDALDDIRIEVRIEHR